MKTLLCSVPRLPLTGSRSALPTTLMILALVLSGFSAHAAPVTAALPRTPAPAPLEPADQAHRAGVRAMADGNLEAARKAFNEALTIQPGHVNALLGLAEVAFNQRQLDEAESKVETALRAAPGHAGALAAQGRLLALRGRVADAEKAFRRAMAADPSLVAPRIDLADLLATRGAHADAAKLYREVVALDPQRAGAHYALGQVLMAQGQLDAAAAAYRAAVSHAPGSVLAPLALARLELGRKRADAALVEVQRILDRQPNQLEALVLKGDAQELQGQPDEALRTYAVAAQAVPKAPLPWLRTGMVEQARGRVDAAEAAYRKVLGLDSRHPLALNNLAALAAERKADLTQAETWAREAVRVAPAVPAFLDTLASVQRAQGRPAEAAKTWRQAQAMAPRDPDLKFQLGRALAEAGDKAEARRWLQEALKSPSGWSNAAEARRLLGNLG